MATRIEDSGRALRDWSSNCRWTIVTASDDSALSVLWNTTVDWYHPKRRDDKLELVDRVSIVLNATDASHRIGEVKASRKFVETEEWEAARKKRAEQWEEDEEDEEPEESEEDEGEEEEEEEDEDGNDEVI